MPRPSDLEYVLSAKLTAKMWLEYLSRSVASLPGEPTLEEVIAHARNIANVGMKFYWQLNPTLEWLELSLLSQIPSSFPMVENVSPEVLPPNAKWETPEAIIAGAARHARARRMSGFLDMCFAHMHQPVPAPIGDASQLFLYPADHPGVLIWLQQGTNGWVLAYRQGVAEGLRAAPVALSFVDPAMGAVAFGVYQAHRWPAADLAGPEFAALPPSVRSDIIVSTAPGPAAYIAVSNDYTASRRTVPCFFLQYIGSVERGSYVEEAATEFLTDAHPLSPQREHAAATPPPQNAAPAPQARDPAAATPAPHAPACHPAPAHPQSPPPYADTCTFEAPDAPAPVPIAWAHPYMAAAPPPERYTW